MNQDHIIPKRSDDRLNYKEVVVAHKLIQNWRSYIREILDPNFWYRNTLELISALERQLWKYAEGSQFSVINRRAPYNEWTWGHFYDDITRLDVEVDESLIGTYPMLKNGVIYIPILSGVKYIVIRNLGDKAKELFHTIKSGIAHEYYKSSQLISQLNQDKLTWAYNRQFVESFSRQYTPESMGRNGQKFVIFGIDLNAFKEINDQLGHDTWDKALIAATEALQKVFSRQSDFVCRMSGDEFIVIIDASTWTPAIRDANVALFKRKIHLHLKNIWDTWIPEERRIENAPSLSMSIGVWNMDSNTSLERALIDADLEMLREKPEIGWVLRIARKLKDIKDLSLIPIVLDEMKQIPWIESFQDEDRKRASEIIDELSAIFQRNSTAKK